MSHLQKRNSVYGFEVIQDYVAISPFCLVYGKLFYHFTMILPCISLVFTLIYNALNHLACFFFK